MDRHDLAHYGIAGALFIAVGGTYFATKPAPNPWAPLVSAKLIDFEAKAAVLDPAKIDVLCIDIRCEPIAGQVAGALKNAGKMGIQDRPISIPDGVSIGAKTAEGGAALKAAVEALGLKVSNVAAPYDLTYVGFGRPEGSAK